MAKLLMGGEVAKAIDQKTKNAVEMLKADGITPTLTIIRVGEKPSDLAYERGAKKKCDAVGVLVKCEQLDFSSNTQDVINVINKINEDTSVHGMLILFPLPPHINQGAIAEAIKPEKDVDGITEGSVYGVYSNQSIGFPPCTPKACIELLDYYNIKLEGTLIALVGWGLVGKPLSTMLLHREATVMQCHKKTVNMENICIEAQIIIAAAGFRNVVTASCVNTNQVIIDVGINENEQGKLCGDVDFANVEPIVESITPVPGGIGSLTTSVLASHVAIAAKQQQ